MKLNTKSWLYKYVLESKDITEAKVWNDDNSDYHWEEYTTTCAIAWALCRTAFLWFCIILVGWALGAFPIIGLVAWAGYNPFSLSHNMIVTALIMWAAYVADIAIAIGWYLGCLLGNRRRDSHITESVIVQTIADWFNKACRKVEIVED